MKLTIICLLLLLHGVNARAQEPLYYRGQHHYLTVTAGEQLVLAMGDGRVAITNAPASLWRPSPLVPNSPYIITLAKANPAFFNRDTGFVAMEYGGIYHTVNGGKNWEATDLKPASIIYTQFALDNGEAWVTLADNKILYSADYGLHWQASSMQPEPEKNEQDTTGLTSGEIRLRALKNRRRDMQYGALFFNTQKEGLAGSVNNLVYTRKFGTDWTTIPTPLQQSKYRKTNTGSAPDILDVAIYNKYYLVQQEELLFYSLKDSINWQLLAGYRKFITDPANSALYLITDNNRVVMADENLHIINTYPETDAPTGYSVRNGILYCITSDDLVRFGAGKSIAFWKMLSVNPPLSSVFLGLGSRPSYKQYYRKGDSIYYRPLLTDVKTQAGKLPRSVSATTNIQLSRDNELACFLSADSVVFYNLITRKSKGRSYRKMLEEFAEKEIRSVTFYRQLTSTGKTDSISYRCRGTSFYLQKKPVKNGETIYSGIPATLDSIAINQLSRSLASRLNQPLTINQLGFTEEEYQECKIAIRQYQKDSASFQNGVSLPAFSFAKNNLDFNKLMASVDKVKEIDTAMLQRELTKIYTTDQINEAWFSISLENKKHEYIGLNARLTPYKDFFFPWSLITQGAATNLACPAANALAIQACPFLLNKDNRIRFLHHLVKAIYLN